MFVEKRLCHLGVEFSDLTVVTRMLKVKHKRTRLLQIFQAIVDHGSNIEKKIITNFNKFSNTPELVGSDIIDIGLRLGGFFNEGAWYNHAIEVLNITEELCKRKEKSPRVLKQLLDCYHK